MLPRLNEALLFAAQAHKDQVRKHTPLPFLVHPVKVMNMLAEWGVEDEDVLIAALLHDTVEDTTVTFDSIGETFGGRVRAFVELLTHTADTPEEKAKYMESFVDKPIYVILIKIADRLDNVLAFYRLGNAKYARKYFEKATCLFDLTDTRRDDFLKAVDSEIFIAVQGAIHATWEEVR